MARFRTETNTITVVAAESQAILDASASNRWIVVTVSAGASTPAIGTGRIGTPSAGFQLVDTTTQFRLGAGEPLWVYAANVATFSVIATDMPEGA